MGIFLALSGVIGRTQQQVEEAWRKYAEQKGGGLQPGSFDEGDPNCSVLKEAGGHTTILHSSGFTAWDDASQYLSGALGAPVFSFHIHDGDLWMYTFFVNGEKTDAFNPIPDYWEEIEEEEEADWKGNAKLLARHIPGLNPAAIRNYLVRWDTENEDSPKAYPGDEYTQEDWQLLDFMKKIGLPFPLGEAGQPTGSVYRFWTKDQPLSEMDTSLHKPGTKPWWKFW